MVCEEDRGADPWLFADMTGRLGMCLSSSMHMLATTRVSLLPGGEVAALEPASLPGETK